MKVIKIILGILLSYGILKGGIGLCIDNPNDIFMYLIITLILMIMPFYLFYSASKTKNINQLEVDENEEIKRINQKNK